MTMTSMTMAGDTKAIKAIRASMIMATRVERWARVTKALRVTTMMITMILMPMDSKEASRARAAWDLKVSKDLPRGRTATREASMGASRVARVTSARVAGKGSMITTEHRAICLSAFDLAAESH